MYITQILQPVVINESDYMKSFGFNKGGKEQCQDPARNEIELNLKFKKLLVVVNKLFIVSSI